MENKMSTNPKQVMRDIEQAHERDVNQAIADTVRDLSKATPKDTGRASRSWRADTYRSGDSETLIRNTVPYIERLNDGWSNQQPRPGWVEQIIQNNANKLAGKKSS
jgi:hypothetical protein